MGSGDRRDSWAFEPGTPLRDGRAAIRLLGGGDRFEGRLGWDEHLCAAVVLKLLPPDQTRSERARRAIAREAAVLRRLAHPYIVRLLDADVEGESPYLVLEFLDGPRLSTLIRRFGLLSHEQLVPLALELGSALAYMHKERQLHLDVKPGNIMRAPPRRSISASRVGSRTSRGSCRFIRPAAARSSS
jgi:serine/threonine protein kinase